MNQINFDDFNKDEFKKSMESTVKWINQDMDVMKKLELHNKEEKYKK